MHLRVVLAATVFALGAVAVLVTSWRAALPPGSELVTVAPTVSHRLISLETLEGADTLQNVIPELLSAHGAYVECSHEQQGSLVSQVSGLLYAYGQRTPEALIELSTRWGGRVRKDMSRDDLFTEWSRSPRRFPWAFAELGAIRADHVKRNSEGAIIHDSLGPGILTRFCYPSFEYPVDIKKLVKESKQIVVSIPMRTIDEQKIRVNWRFVWWQEGRRWISLDMSQQAHGEIGLAQGVF